MSHKCRFSDPWPTGHPLPGIKPERLSGPEVGSTVWYTYKDVTLPAVVLERSYVWSPGECRSNGGHRHYDWSVIQVSDPTRIRYTVVVNDMSLQEA